MIAVDELSRFAQLTSLTEAELAALADAGCDISYPAGWQLITEGQTADRCWLIREGTVSLDAHVPGRGDIAVQTLGNGDLLGWSWLMPPYRWHFGAHTVEPVRAIEFDSARLTELAELDPVFGRALNRMLLEAVLERLQATRARLLDLYRGPGDTASPGPLTGTAESGSSR
ncbi:cyclic nucleotide-binding domain-containing protein [Nocardia sp. NPDC052112]|uniref:Crp/Fnr family transcriptional regulator n=1 Tax=Nocardia sp. NPDC052112 TaxID=3155646 RepID=UPI003437A5DD